MSTEDLRRELRRQEEAAHRKLSDASWEAMWSASGAPQRAANHREDQARAHRDALARQLEAVELDALEQERATWAPTAHSTSARPGSANTGSLKAWVVLALAWSALGVFLLAGGLIAQVSPVLALVAGVMIVAQRRRGKPIGRVIRSLVVVAMGGLALFAVHLVGIYTDWGSVVSLALHFAIQITTIILVVRTVRRG